VVEGINLCGFHSKLRLQIVGIEQLADAFSALQRFFALTTANSLSGKSLISVLRCMNVGVSARGLSLDHVSPLLIQNIILHSSTMTSVAKVYRYAIE